MAYGFDANGNMVTEGAGRSFGWDYADRMRWFAEGTTTATYLYDGGENRVKKVVRKSASLKEVTVYTFGRLSAGIDGGFEYFYHISGSAIVQEMNEIHVVDGRSRVARVREHVGGTWSGPAPEPVLYNLEDHLGNSMFTLTGSGGAHSREEYFPFGETSFGSFARKRYRYCGKERDEESGLYYYGARYYAAWGCRFVSVDPLAWKMPFLTPYCYAANSPVCLEDLDGLAPGGGGGDPIKFSSQSCNPSSKAPSRTEASFEMEASQDDAGNWTLKVTGTLRVFEDGELKYEGHGALEKGGVQDPAQEVGAFWDHMYEGMQRQTGKGTIVGTINSIVREGPYKNGLSGIRAEYPPLSPAALEATPVEVVEKMARAANAKRNVLRKSIQEMLTVGGRMLSRAIERDRSFETLLRQKLSKFGGDMKRALNAIIAGASKSNRAMSLLSKAGKYVGPVVVLVGMYGSGKRLLDAANGRSKDGLTKAWLKEYFSWTSAVIGAELGAAAGALVTEAVPLLCPYPSIILGFIGGLLGGIFGEEAVETYSQIRFDSTQNEIDRAGVPIYDKF